MTRTALNALVESWKARALKAEQRAKELEAETTRWINKSCGFESALRHIKKEDGPGLDGSPGGPCYEIAKKVLP